jgi:hypothetical protein
MADIVQPSVIQQLLHTPCPYTPMPHVTMVKSPSRRAAFLIACIATMACASPDTGGDGCGAAPSADQQRSAAGLPVEAYGIFEDRNDPTFQRVLLVEANSVVVTTTVTVGGRPVGNPLQCRSDAGLALGPSLSLDLSCAGERIPFTLEFRADAGDWVVVEDGSAPMMFRRR